MTDLETSMATIISVFQKYSEREGDKHKLKKNELKDLLHDELPDLMTVRHNVDLRRKNGDGRSQILCISWNKQISLTKANVKYNKKYTKINKK